MKERTREDRNKRPNGKVHDRVKGKGERTRKQTKERVNEWTNTRADDCQNKRIRCHRHTLFVLNISELSLSQILLENYLYSLKKGKRSSNVSYANTKWQPNSVMTECGISQLGLVAIILIKQSMHVTVIRFGSRSVITNAAFYVYRSGFVKLYWPESLAENQPWVNGLEIFFHLVATCLQK